MIIFKPPEYIAYILRRLTENGHDAFLVGGCVRDSIMGRIAHDWDAASSAAPAEVSRIFQKTALTGEKYGTVTVILPEGTVEVTTFRAESGYKDGRRPGNVEFVKNLLDDLGRRDFTMNAMAISSAGELTDPFGGFEDIKNRLIRCVGDPDTRFSEDALRMFRAFRFSAELGFTIESGTLASIKKNAERAAFISAERIRAELERALLSKRPEAAGDMIETGLLARYTEISDKNPGNLERLAALPAEAALRWCAFCAILIDKGFISAPGDFLRAIRLDANTIKTCKSALSIDSFPESADDNTGLKRLLAKHGTAPVRCAAAARDTLRGGSALAVTDGIIHSGECFSLSALAVSGSDLITLGLPPGREIGHILAGLLDRVIMRPEDNDRGILMKMIEGPAEK